MARNQNRCVAVLRCEESSGSSSWNAGWYKAARPRPSPNFGPRPPSTGGDIDISLIVLHSISLPPGVYGGDAIERFFLNQLDWNAHPYFQTIIGQEVSAHFVIQRDGGLMQFVSCLDRAWHAGASSFQGRADCNSYSVGIELEGLEGQAFDDAQYVCLVKLVQALALQYPIRAITGHEHVAPGRKHDPGAGFLWACLQKSLGWPASAVSA